MALVVMTTRPEGDPDVLKRNATPLSLVPTEGGCSS